MPHVAEDEIASSDDDTFDSEDSDVEVDVACVSMPPPLDGEVPVDELDVYQLTDEQLLQRLAEACEHFCQALWLTTLSIRHC